MGQIGLDVIGLFVVHAVDVEGYRITGVDKLCVERMCNKY